VTRLRFGGKYATSQVVANLLLSPTVKEFVKSANISQSYEWHVFMARGVTSLCNLSLSFSSAICNGVTRILVNGARPWAAMLSNLLLISLNRATYALVADVGPSVVRPLSVPWTYLENQAR